MHAGTGGAQKLEQCKRVLLKVLSRHPGKFETHHRW